MSSKLTLLLLLLALSPAVLVHAGSICSEGYWTYESTGRPATGSIRVQLFKNMELHVTGSFSGLSSLTTGLRLYGLSGSAVQSSFPAGAKAGYINMRFNLNHASSYDPTFLLNSDNNVTQAMILVADSIYTSLFSVTITSLQYPNGELTSSTQPCASNLCYSSKISGGDALPTNNSPGTANAQLTIDAYGDVRIQGVFSTLSATTTSLQIYTCSESGGTIPSNPLISAQSMRSFPVGKYSDSFTVVFHLQDELSYDQGYLSAYNSSVIKAANAFINALDNGIAYIAIQTTSYPQGEVAGYLRTCQYN